jgi:hypothetical protein
LDTELLDTAIELGGSGVLAGIAVSRDDDVLACVDDLRVEEVEIIGPATQFLVELVQRNLLHNKTVAEVITEAVDQLEYCIQ